MIQVTPKFKPKYCNKPAKIGRKIRVTGMENKLWKSSPLWKISYNFFYQIFWSMPNVKAQLIRALARFMANHDAKIKRITSTEGFKKASMATRTIYEQTYKFVNCCVNCTTKMVTEQGKTIGKFFSNFW